MGTQLQLEPGALWAILPMILVGGVAFVVLLWDTVVKPTQKLPLLLVSLAGIAVAAVISVMQWGEIGEISRPLFSGRFALDRFGIFFNLLFLGVAALVLLLSRDFLDREEIHIGEYYALMLFAVLGMMVLSMSTDLLMIFIGVEVMSISVYVLAAFNRGNYRCIEGALKYFILGSFASGFLVYGIALLYGETGSTGLPAIREYLSSPHPSAWLLPVALTMLLIAFGFKVAAVPFHMWAPDVYEGASTPVTAAMATGVKAASFAAVIRTFLALAPAHELQEVLIWGLAAVTMVVGNITAIRQTNIKRMLAYSSIAHTGYMFAGLLAVQSGGDVSQSAISSLLFYLAAYVLMNIGAFGIIILIGRKEEEPVEMSDWSGLGFRYPWLGAAMTLFMLSLGGMPPTAGFFGKFYLFSTLVSAGYTWLVVLAVLTSAASFYYYLRVVVYMYMYPAGDRWSPQISSLAGAALVFAFVGTIWLGVAPSGPLSFIEWARASVRSLI